MNAIDTNIWLFIYGLSKPGTYRIVLTAIDGSSNRSKQISRAFTVKRHT